MAKARMFGQITKVEDMGDGTRMVSGIASTPHPADDCEGESFTGDCMRGAIPEYMKKSRAVREMHQPIAAGTTKELYVDDDDITHITAHVVDPVSVLKLDTGVLKMFSIGGNIPPGGRDSVNRKIINKLNLREVSLVDVGGNSRADILEITKLDGEIEEEAQVAEEVETTTAAEVPAVEAPVDPANRHRGESFLSSPATPPDKRVRIRRFEKLRLAESRDTQTIGPSDVQHLMQEHSAVAPPATSIPRHLCRHFG